jgi:hypothetical protein
MNNEKWVDGISSHRALLPLLFELCNKQFRISLLLG